MNQEHLHNVLFFHKDSEANTTILEETELLGSNDSISLKEMETLIGGDVFTAPISNTQYLFVTKKSAHHKTDPLTIGIAENDEITDFIAGNCLVVKVNKGKMIGLTKEELHKLRERFIITFTVAKIGQVYVINSNEK